MRKGMILGVLLVLLSLAAISALLLRPATVIGVTEKSLAYSLRGANDAGQTGECRGSDDRWTCTAYGGGEASESAVPSGVYDIEVDDFGCWKATRKGGGRAELDGCITVVDLVRLDD